MKKSTRCICGAAIVAMSAFSARGSLLVSDSFTYPDGNLVGDMPAIGGAWNAHSGTTAPILVSGDSINVNEATGVQDDNAPFAGAFVDAAGDVLYSSFSVTIPTAPTTLTPVYFGMFLNGTSNFTSRLWVDTPSSAGYRLALTQNSNVNPTVGTAVYSSDLAFGQTYTVVTSYDFTNKNGMLWINPTSVASPSLGTTTDAGFSDPVSAYAFRQSATAGNVIINVDNLEVGTTFADVIPEPASLGLLLGCAGLVFTRRSRRA
jgi:hypothetical protein